jgi:hypothetical protein
LIGKSQYWFSVQRDFIHRNKVVIVWYIV